MLRNKCRKAANFCRNYAPFIHPILHHTNPNTQGCRQFSEWIQKREFDQNQWKNFENLAVTHNIDHDSLQAQIIKLANTSKLIEGKDLQYLMLRNTCITNTKLYRMNILTSSECTLCLHPTQDSAHRYFSCPFILPVWELLGDLTEGTSTPHTFTFSCAIINVRGTSKNHPLVLLTNFTRLLINKAHINNNKIHPNTYLYKVLNLANIMHVNDPKFGQIWGEIGDNCKKKLKPYNPQIFST